MKEVSIEIKSCYDNADEIWHEMKGQRYDGKGKVCLKFMMPVSENDPPVDTILTVEDMKLAIHRKGELSGDLCFEAGRKKSSKYNTPAGLMLLEIQTHTLDIMISEEVLKIRLEYDVLEDGHIITTVRMRIAAVNG